MSIRLRVAVVFSVALATAFGLGSWLFVAQLSSALMRSTDTQLAAQLSQADRYLTAAGPGAAPAPVGRRNPAPGEYVVQLIDASGQVRGASQDAGSVPLLTPTELRQARSGQLAVTQTIDGERARLVGAPAAGHPGWVAVAGVSLESFDSTLRDVTRELLIGGAVFVLVAGLGAYWLARVALAPVERLRREAAALSERDPASRLRIPGTKDEIAALAGTMNDLLSRLQHALARQRAFVADASHELRTPFAVLRGELELAGRPGRSREELAAAVASAAEEAARLTRITDDLLLLARSDEATLTPRPEPTDIGVLLARSAEPAGARAAEAGVICRVEAPAGLEVLVDPDRIRQAVDNLLDNALRFAPAGTEVVVSARMVGPDLVLEVRDSGSGFPTEFLPHAFERFRRPDSGRARSEGGAGLGLAIVQAIALAHGGRAIATNRPEGGAVVSLELPVVDGRSTAPQAEVPGPARSRESPHGSAPAGGARG